MPESQPIEPPTHRPEPFRYDRREVVTLLDEALHDPEQPSLRAFAEEHDLPPSTLHYWQRRREHLAAPQPLCAFFESPAGLAFLHRLTLAIHVSFQQANGVGIRAVIGFHRERPGPHAFPPVAELDGDEIGFLAAKIPDFRSLGMLLTTQKRLASGSGSTT